ncbi:Eco57I restriction-modification methylase domain-containing protein [Nocardia sp. NPDC058176]|uniref:Eco57I restriction-modification methylase domain-containing protein n=1 Tax=Nocardia sp. NPDC058176 TaxID=3346368 RepID=UPI0036D7BD95
MVSLADLRKKFDDGTNVYNAASGYSEDETRIEFIDPVLDLLGWDVANKLGLIPSKREVVRETRQVREGGADKRPDYTVRASGLPRFHVEAKKPYVDIRIDRQAIFQARRYGYTDRHAIVVLTNYRSLVIYDASVPVDETIDRPETARLFTWDYDTYEANWDEIKSILGRDEVHGLGWEDRFQVAREHQPLPADEAFIQHFNQWRVEIGTDILARDPSVDAETVNDAVQQLLNRLIFVRMCEDRGIEGEETLRKAFAHSSTTTVSGLFKRLNRRYNTGLFSTAGNVDDSILRVSTGVLAGIVDRLYSPKSPFSFAVLDADFLGLVYEASLAEHLVITGSGRREKAELAKKAEYTRRDVVTTPQALVDATVEAAVERLDHDLREPNVLDFATGSGRFLLAAFNQVAERETLRRVADGDTDGLLRVSDDEWRLSFEEKKHLLAESFFGIDVDYNAVEVARFSLLVRLLDDETGETLPKGQKILPDLTQNIVHGNTLVRELPNATADELDLTNPLDLGATALPAEFNLIVGNPPYMSAENMKNYDPREYQYLKAEYETTERQFDKYFPFVELAVTHLAPAGLTAVVIPNKWMTVVSAKMFRALLRGDVSPVWLTNFRHVTVFEGKSVYVCALVLQADAAGKPLTYAEPESFEEFALGRYEGVKLPASALPSDSEGPWVLPANPTEKKVFDALFADSIPLAEVFDVRNGVQTSRNSVYILTNVTAKGDYVEFTKPDPKTKQSRHWKIEKAVTRPYIDDSRLVRSRRYVRPDSLIIYPYWPAPQNPSGVQAIPEAVMKKDYPLAYAYLLAHKADLENRDAQARRQMRDQGAFYVYGRTQAIGYSPQQPKIIYSVNQKGRKYGMDAEGIIVQSGGTAGEVMMFQTGDYSLDFVLALLDQPEIEMFLRKRGSPFRGGYYARGSDVIAAVPLPRLDFGDPQDVLWHSEISSKALSLRHQTEDSDLVPARKQAQHQNQMRLLAMDIRLQFLARWRLKEVDVQDLR